MDKVFSTVLLFELLLPPVVLAAVLAVAILRRRRKDVRAMRVLVDKVQARDGERLSALRAFLADHQGFGEPELGQRVILIDSQRKAFYQALVQAFLKHDAEAIARLDEPLDAYVDAYHLLAHQERSEPAPAVPGEGEDTARLQADNRRLKDELAITLSTLNNIFAEYTSMFGEQAERTDLSVDEIIAAMEKYSGQQPGKQEPALDSETVVSSGMAMLAEADSLLAQQESAPQIPDELSLPESAETDSSSIDELDMDALMASAARDEPLPQTSAPVVPEPAPQALGDGDDEEELSKLIFAEMDVEEGAEGVAAEALPEAEESPSIVVADLEAPPMPATQQKSVEELDVDDLDALFRRAQEDAERNN